MNKSELRQYFKEKYSEIDIREGTIKISSNAIKSSATSILNKIASRHLKISENQKDMTALIAKMTSKTDPIESTILEHRLKEALRLKHELASKLEQVDESINALSTIVPAKAEKFEKKHLVKSLKEDEKWQEEEKLEQAQELAKNLSKQQKLRQKRLEERQRLIEEKIKNEEEVESYEKEIEQEKKAEERRRKLEEVQEKAQERRAYLENLKWDLHGAPIQKRLYQKMQEEFEVKVLMPELEKRKEELAKKRMQPITKEEIMQHAKEYQSRIQNEKEVRERYKKENTNSIKFSPRTKAMQTILEQDEQEKMKKNKEEMERKELLNKKKRYAELIKQLYPPEIDQLKKKEMEMIKERLNMPGRIRHSQTPSMKSTIFTAKETSRDGEKSSCSESTSTPKRMKSISPLKPPPATEKKEKNSKTPDYLSTRREINKKLEKELMESKLEDIKISADLSPSDAKKQAHNLETLSKRHEIMLKHNVNKFDLSAIEAEEKVNNMILESVKAKLSLVSASTQ